MKVIRSQIEQIKTEAYSLGFCLVGATPATKPPHFEEYKTWLNRREFGDMTYLARQNVVEKRSDPNLLLPSARSFLVLGYPYPIPETSKNTFAGTGRIASYALLPDYHLILKQKMLALVDHVKRIVQGDFLHREFVDTSPVMEKDIAGAAGLGWMGRNSCLISPQKGSFFFLSEILTDLEFESENQVVADKCGNCSQCIEACPVQCIQSERTLAANRCISYLTIEHKGVIPKDLRPLMGNNIFGCDICQVVCPWNRKALQTSTSKTINAEKLIPSEIDLSREIFLDEQQFTEKYDDHPVYHIGRNRYLRNIAIAIGNQKSVENIEILEKAILVERDGFVRVHLYWALGETNSRKVDPLLRKYLESETDPQCILEINDQFKNDRAFL